jgi:hypothetical protein
MSLGILLVATSPEDTINWGLVASLDPVPPSRLPLPVDSLSIPSNPSLSWIVPVCRHRIEIHTFGSLFVPGRLVMP